MNTQSKREAALKVLASTGMWRSSYAPPLLRLLWRLGFDVPPPHFGTFWSNALSMGAFFAVAWGLLMWFLFWSHQGMPPVIAFASAGAAGVMFGFAMAGYYAYGNRKHNLPSWRDFNPQS